MREGRYERILQTEKTEPEKMGRSKSSGKPLQIQ